METWSLRSWQFQMRWRLLYFCWSFVLERSPWQVPCKQHFMALYQGCLRTSLSWRGVAWPTIYAKDTVRTHLGFRVSSVSAI